MKKILFICVANSARSQLAEGLAKMLFGERAEVMSAGSNPGTIHPSAVLVMNEIGIDISQNYSKSIDCLPELFLENLDYIITLCEDEVCPNFLSQALKMHWPFPDPVKKNKNQDEQISEFREVRNAIEIKLRDFAVKEKIFIKK